MPILRLFRGNRQQTLIQLVSLPGPSLCCLLCFHFLRGQLVSQIFVLVSELLILALDACDLFLRLLPVHFVLVPAAPRLLPEVQIRLSLPQHVIHRSYGLLDVIRPPTEKVSYRWYSITLLGCPNILQVIHKCGYQELLVIWLRGLRGMLKVLVQAVHSVPKRFLTHFKFEI
jgi:hypothetical protein